MSRRNRTAVGIILASGAAIFAVVGVAELLPPMRAMAQVPDAVTVAVTPATIRVAPEGESRAIVVVTNSSKKRMTSVEVALSTPDSISVEPTHASPIRLHVGESSAVSFALSRTSTGSLPATGLVRVDYIHRIKMRKVPQTIVQPFDIVAQETEPAEQLAAVELKKSGAVLDDFHDVELAAIVTNKSASTLTVTSVRPAEPEGQIDFTPPAITEATTISPRHQRVFQFRMSVAEGRPIKSGEALVLVRINVAVGSDGAGRTASFSSAQAINLGVFGESDIGEVAKIPSLLFLPGFMALAAIVVLGQIAWFRLGKVGTAIGSSPVVFGFLMILVSVATLVSYWALTRRDLRYGYSFNDVLRVSLLGVIGAVVLALVLRIASMIWFWYVGFREDDAPLEALEKLGRRGKGLRLPGANLTGGTVSILVYEMPRQDTEVAVVGPEMCVNYLVNEPDLEEAVNKLRNEGKSPKQLSKLLKRAVQEKKAEVRWNPPDGTAVTGLTLLHKNKLDMNKPPSDVLVGC